MDCDGLKYVPGQYANLSVVGGWFGFQDGSYEEFIAAEPDVIIESIDEGGDGDLSTVKERQEKFGTIPVVAVRDTINVEKVGESILFMGKVVGAEDKANELNDFNNKYLDMVNEKSSKLQNSDKRTVYYASGDDGLQTNPSGSSHGRQLSFAD